MTRKKFVKQLMALGCQRNEANTLAYLARIRGMSYQTALQYERARLDAQNIIDRVAHVGLTTVTPTLRNFADRFMEAWRNVAQRFQREAAAYELPRLYALDKEDALKPAPEWTKENPHLAGLNADVFLMDERDWHGGGGNE